MVTAYTKTIIERAKQIYEAKLRTLLESRHVNRFVAVEPESEEYFVADTFDAAIEAARTAHPTRLSFVIRIGHPAALHLGGVWS